MKKVIRLLIVLVLAIVLTLGAHALSERTLTMPAALNVIGERAFFGSTSIDRVVLPEGVTEIRSKAFAQSSITAINLPASLTYIAEDAFSGVTGLTVNAPADSYGYAWAQAHGFNVHDPDITGQHYLEACAIIDQASYQGNDGDSFVDVIGMNQHTRGNVDIYGVSHAHGLEAWIARRNNRSESSWAYAVFDLGSAYQTLSGTVGLIQSYNTTNFDTTLYFYDGERLIKSYRLTPGALPFAFSIDVSGVDALKVYVKDNTAVAGGTAFGIFDAVLETTPVGCFTFRALSETACEVTGYRGSYTDVIIPSQNADGRLVTRIGEYAFKDCTTLASITIPASVTSIASNAFDGVTGLTVTAKVGTYAYTWAVEHGYINEVFTVEITADGNNVPLYGTKQLTAAVETVYTNLSYAWSSSNESIATVDPNGKVTGVSEGEATITVTVTTEGGTRSISASYDVIVCMIRIDPADGWYMLAAADDTHFVLDVQYWGRNVDGTNIGLAESIDSAAQRFRLERTNFDTSKSIINQRGKYISLFKTEGEGDINWSNTHNVALSTGWSTSYAFYDAGDGDVFISCNAPNYLTYDKYNGALVSGSMAGANVCLSPLTGASSQRWRLIPASQVTEVESVDIIGDEWYMPLIQGQTKQMQIEVLPANATNPGVNWWSDDPTIASVDQNGLITASGTKAGIVGIHCEAKTGLIDADTEHAYRPAAAFHICVVEPNILGGRVSLIPKANTAMRLDLPYGELINGNQFQICTSNGLNCQQFALVALGDGYYKIEHSGAWSNYCVELNSSNRENVELCQHHGGANQQWMFVPAGDGYYFIINRFTGCAMACTGTGDNASVIVTNIDDPANRTAATMWMPTVASLTKPQDVVSCTITNVTETSATLSWTGVSDANRYDLHLHDATGNEIWTEWGITSPYTITGLNKGSYYRIMLASVSTDYAQVSNDYAGWCQRTFMTAGGTTSKQAYVATYWENLIGQPAKEHGPGTGTQCVEVVNFYIEDYFGLNNNGIGSDGNYYYRKLVSTYPSHFMQIDYYDGITLQPGDIISYHSTTSPTYGHVAIVYWVSGNTYKIAEQWKGSNTVRTNTKTIAAPVYGQSYTIIGIARPIWSSFN